MSQLLFDWLNEDVRLSRKVIAFGEDFRDGYMFGELLSKFNQQLDFNQFSAKGTPGARLNNFCLLEPSMRKIGVHFNSRIVTDIMAGKETITKNLLYEMKTALEGIYRINKQSNNQMLHGTASDKALHVIKPTRALYEKTISATFEKAIHGKIENSNEVMMSQALKHHTSKAEIYLQTMGSADSDAYDDFMNTRLREKEINRNKKEKADEFAKTREAQHVAQWKTNQRIAHDRRNLKAKVEQDQFTRKQGMRSRFLAATRHDTLQDVDAFNDRLEASLLVAGADVAGEGDSLIKTTTNVPGDHTLSLMYVDRETQRRGLEATQKKMKEHHEDIAVRTLEHDQRRRKFLREYDTMQMKMSQKIFSTEVIAQLLNFAASEKEEQGRMEEVVYYKKIIPDNRHNRQHLMDHMAEADFQRAKQWDAVEAQREVDWTIGGARAAHSHRSAVLGAAVASAERQISTAIALQTIDKLLDVVEWVVSCRQVGVFYYTITEDPAVLSAPLPEVAPAGGKKGKEKEKPAAAVTVSSDDAPPPPPPRSCEEGAVVPSDLWADAAKMFVSDDPLALGLQSPAPLTVTDALWPFSISDRPACAEIDWLFAQPFQASQQLLAPSQVTVTAAPVDANEAADAASAASSLELASSLAAADVRDFIDALNSAEISVGLGEEGRTPTEAPAPTETSTLYTPTWLTSVQPRYVLGEAIIAVRSAVDPVPEEPAARIDTTHIPLRVALCGVSELARKNLVEAAVKQIPGLTVIAVAELVSRAFEFHSAALEASAVAQQELITAATVSGPLFVIEELSEVVEEGDSMKSTGLHAAAVVEEKAVEDVSVEAKGALAESDAPVDPDTAAAAVEATPDPEPIQEPIPEPTPDPFVALAGSVYECLLAGQTIPDELYVSLVVHGVQQIHARNTGYVLQDFPSTKRQALLLMEAFSGMDYSARRPQPTDKVSRFAPPSPAEEWTFDVAKCGLDAIIHVDNGAGIGTAFEQRARARRVTETGDVIYISDDQVTIKGLEGINDPARPFHATGIDLTVAEASNAELLEFCAKIRLLQQFTLADYATPEEAMASKAQELCERYVPADYFLPGYLPGTEPIPEPEPEREEKVQAEVEVEQPEPAEETVASGLKGEVAGGEESGEHVQAEGGEAAVGKEDTPMHSGEPSEISAPAAEGGDGEAVPEPAVEEEEVVKEKYVYQQPPAIFKPNAIPVALADALLRMWNTSEEQSGRKAAAFFSAVRDVRYQMVQRRRAAFDSVSTLLVKLDNRQELFDAFRKTFNGVPPDMRFDPDCVAELHLQKLELCDALQKLSEERKSTAEAYSKKIGADAVVTVLQHRCKCECVAMAQSELQRFFVALHLLFDYSKAVRGYEMHAKMLNELEVTLPVTLPAEAEGGGKKEGKPKEAKKGKEVPGALVPFREPIAPVLVPRSSMEAVPELNGGEEAVDPKAKKAPAKDKKGGASESADPFTDIEAKVLEEAEKWRKGVFQVTREVYEKDEPLCCALEKAIWYETEKLVLAIINIRSKMDAQVAWLDAAEQEINSVLRDLVSKRYLKELSAVNQLVERIEQQIEDARPVPAFWLVSPDSIAVDPATAWEEFLSHLPPHLHLHQQPPPAVVVPKKETTDSPPASPQSLHGFKPCMSPQNKSLLDRARKSRGTGNANNSGFVPEHSDAATDLDGAAAGRKKVLEKQPVNSKTSHLRRASAVPVTAESSADEQFRKEMAIFEAKRLVFEDRLLKRRAQREKDFRLMGMSAAMAKLAAYNELLLDEQQDMLDFEARFRPKRRPNSHAARRSSNAVAPGGSGARRPSSAVGAGAAVAEGAHRRPISANAAVH